MQQICFAWQTGGSTPGPDGGRGSATAYRECFWVETGGGGGGRNTGGEFGGIGGGRGGFVRSTGIPIADRYAAVDKDCGVGNPILPSTGNKVEIEADFSSSGEMPLELIRSYNHYWQGAGLFGKHWISSFDYKLTFGSVALNTCYPRPGGGTCGIGANSVVYAWRPDGRTIKFAKGADGIFYEDKPQPVARIVQQADGQFVLYSEERAIETYSSAGYISTVTNEQGIGWTFSYTNGTYPHRVIHTSGRYVEFAWSSGQLTAVRDPAGSYYGFSYNPNYFGAGLHRLNASSQPASPVTTTTYHYENVSDGSALTGKSYNGVRYSKFAYSTSGYAISTEHSGLDKHTLTYTSASDGTLTTVETNPLGKQTTYVHKQGKVVSITGHASTYCPSSTYALSEYDANGYPVMRQDFNGVFTDTYYNAKGQLTQKVEAAGTPLQRVTRYEWDSTTRLLSETLEGQYKIQYVYTSDGRIASVTTTNLAAPSPASNANQIRTTNYSYTKHANGMLATVVVDGHIEGAGDAITTSFDSLGNVVSVKNSLGHTTAYSNFNGLGQPGRVVGANGDIADYTYDQRARIIKVRKYPDGSTPADTVYIYNENGTVKSITAPDGTATSFSYDVALRMTERYLGTQTAQETGGPVEMQRFYYNAAGDMVRSDNLWELGFWEIQQPCAVWGPDGTCWELGPIGPEEPTNWVDESIVTQRNLIDYDELSRPRAYRGNYGRNVRYTYDSNGNVRTVTDSAGKVTTFGYDALNRTIYSIAPDNNGTTWFEYDAADRVTKVTDPLGKATYYVYDGFGQLWKQISPDSGTISFTYDASGLRTSMIRNDGSVTTFGYDGLGRLTAMTSAGSTKAYVYDVCNNGQGRLCALGGGGNGSVVYGYTPDGRIWARIQYVNLNGVETEYWNHYYYDVVGRLNAVSYPNGVAVGYGYANGKLTAMTVNIGGVISNVVTGASYRPFGSVESWSYGNGLSRNYIRDLDGRITSIGTYNGSSAIQGLSYGYNANDLIVSIGNNIDGFNSTAFGYDSLSRMTSHVNQGGTTTTADTLDAIGNRTERTQTGVAARLYSYQSVGSQLTSISGAESRNFSYDATGDLIGETGSNGSRTYAYDGAKRLEVSWVNGTASVYGYNAYNERIWKSAPHGQFRYVYGPGSVLMGERRESDGQWTNYLWFNGELVGLVRSGQLFFVHNDHLGRPELVTNMSKSAVWKAANYPYSRGVTLDSIGGLNVGFPGQYSDQETGLWYNINRYYDSSLGRYIQSDPIGLGGGLNTYAYVRGNPISLIDPLGLVDRNYIPPWDHLDNYGGMQLIPSRPGELTVGVHFNGTNFIGPNGQNWSATDLANQIKADTDLTKYKAITLYSCRAGAPQDGKPAPAQDLAKLLGLPVQATASYVWTTNNPIAPYQGVYGKTPSGGIDRSNPGQWVYFYPGGP